MISIYLDNCILNRPFDDQTFERIYLETQSFLILLKRIEDNQVMLSVSFANRYEAEKINHKERLEQINFYLDMANNFIDFDSEIETRAQSLNKIGFGAMDSLHLAAAEKATVDYFVTCDDNLIKNARRQPNKVKINVITLHEMIELFYYA